jgi:hypothetical protein
VHLFVQQIQDAQTAF